MEVDQSTHLLDLPNEVLEEIVDHLRFVAVRNNLRLTCKRLHSLCDSERVCRNEVIFWPRNVERQRHMIAAFTNSSRGCYNLAFISVSLANQEVSVFFEQHGAKVRSLVFEHCGCLKGILESIITSCEGLISLNIDTGCHSYDFAFESNSVSRPSVTSLRLDLSYRTWNQTPDIVDRISKTFPCVKCLDIKFDECDNAWKNTRTLPVRLSSMSNLSRLRSLYLQILPGELLAEEPQLFPKLQELHLLFHFYDFYGQGQSIPLQRWPIFISRLKGVGIASVTITKYSEMRLTDIIPLLNEPGLESLDFWGMHKLHFTPEDFQALVSSHLKTIYFGVFRLAPGDVTAYNFPGKANKTVTNMTVCHGDYSTKVTVLFPTYFHGLVHLHIHHVDDAILQSIFKYQRNLRSLVLFLCQKCSLAGFFGAGDVQFENSITNLQKLEHLQIDRVEDEVFQSEQFQSSFSFPQLKYLSIYSTSWFKEPKLEIPVDMLKSNVCLEAVELNGFIPPDQAKLSSLFQSLKYLNYLRVARLHPLKRLFYVNLKHFYWFDSTRFLSNCSPKVYRYNQYSDRTVCVFSCETAGTRVPIHSPKIGSFTVNWISI